MSETTADLAYSPDHEIVAALLFVLTDARRLGAELEALSLPPVDRTRVDSVLQSIIREARELLFECVGRDSGH